MARIPVALQMYTVRDDQARDFAGTFEKVAAIGYEGAELAGTGGLTATELRNLLDGLGLRIAGGHVGLPQLETELNQALDYYSELGSDYITCPWLPEERRKSAEDYRRLAATLTEVGAKTKERGIQLCYHNHAFEFTKFDGENALDILFSASDPNLVKSELDTYWVEYGGESAVAYLTKYAGRVPLVHLKDMTPGENRTFAELGEGTIDWDAVLSACESASAQTAWYIVEQDTCQRPPLESARISFDYLRAKGRV